MTRTDAPKLLGGRLDLNLARTTPLFPALLSVVVRAVRDFVQHTVWSGDFAPDDADLGASD
jgi:hypothetical protein